MKKRRRWIIAGSVVGALALAGLGAWWWLTPERRAIETGRAMPSPEVLEAHCAEGVGDPRVEEVTDGVFVAIGYDLANTILVQTDAGNVVIDVSISPAAATRVKAALNERAPGPTKAIIFTHSHIDHIGGASAWVEPGTEVWATDGFVEHFFKQYGRFRPAEQVRGARQFGHHVGLEQMACSGLGARPNLEEVTRTGIRMPTRVFDGEATFEVGGVRFELVEAHGETHDQLFVYLPQKGVLLPGDNYYRAFPNLYTIRGTSPRPVDAWIESLDRIRAKDPEFLIPSHTVPLSGRQTIRRQLRDYRDGIQWVRDAVVRGANAGKSVDELAAEVGLPPHLRAQPALAELYGQIDWSVRAIYANELGWFDGRATRLYALDPDDEATRFIAMMGGEQAVADAARSAANEEPRWALRLVELARDARTGSAWVDEVEAMAVAALGESTFNTNGRGYLLERERELAGRAPPLPTPSFDDELIDAIPLSLLFEVMTTRLDPELAADAEESIRFELDEEVFVLTVRRGVAELIEGGPLPDTPDPLAIVRAEPGAWKRIALGLMSPREAIADGTFSVEGDQAGFIRFIQRFDRGA